MYRIEQYERPLGGGHAPHVVKENAGEMFERADAVRDVIGFTGRYAHSGYDREQDYWWGRNDGDAVVTIFAIRAV